MAGEEPPGVQAEGPAGRAQSRESPQARPASAGFGTAPSMAPEKRPACLRAPLFPGPCLHGCNRGQSPVGGSQLPSPAAQFRITLRSGLGARGVSGNSGIPQKSSGNAPQAHPAFPNYTAGEKGELDGWTGPRPDLGQGELQLLSAPLAGPGSPGSQAPSLAAVTLRLGPPQGSSSWPGHM